jgi:hypothetical protein
VRLVPQQVIKSVLSGGTVVGCCVCCAAGARKVSAPSHSQLHVSLRRYTPLIQLMAALEPQALTQLQQQVGLQTCSRLGRGGARRGQAGRGGARRGRGTGRFTKSALLKPCTATSLQPRPRDLWGVQVHCSWSSAMVCPAHLCMLPPVCVPQQHCMTDSTAAAGARTDLNPGFGGMPPSAQVCQELNGLLRRELRLASGELRRAATAELATAGSAGEGDYTMARDRSSSAAATTG